MPASSPGFPMEADGVALLLGPADIHPRQHVGPVAAFGAARPALISRKVSLPSASPFSSASTSFAAARIDQGAQRSLGLGHDLVVALGFAQFDQLDIVLQAAFDVAIGRDRIISA